MACHLANNMDICYWAKKLNQNKLNHSEYCYNLVIIIVNYKCILCNISWTYAMMASLQCVMSPTNLLQKLSKFLKSQIIDPLLYPVPSWHKLSSHLYLHEYCCNPISSFTFLIFSPVLPWFLLTSKSGSIPAFSYETGHISLLLITLCLLRSFRIICLPSKRCDWNRRCGDSETGSACPHPSLDSYGNLSFSLPSGLLLSRALPYLENRWLS